MTAPYTVNTTVNLHPVVIPANSSMLTVMMLVDSKSNFSDSLLQFLPTRSAFEYYYNDEYTEYSETLLQAQSVVNFGYNVLAYNVRKCAYPETLRIYKDSSGEYQGSWFDQELDVKPISTTLHSDQHLAVKFKLADLSAGRYVLFEHLINNKMANCYVGDYTTGQVGDVSNVHQPLIPSVNYANKAAHEFVYDAEHHEESLQELISILSTEESYTCAYTSDGYMHIMFPYEFRVPEFSDEDWEKGDPRRVKVEYDEVFLYQYINNVKFKSKILDIYSKYNSELEDLAVEFSYQHQTYYAAIYKYQNGNTIIDSENFSSSDINQLYALINYNSKYIRLEPYSDEFPTGTFKLRQMHDPKVVTIDDYYAAFDFLKSFVDEEYNFDANIFLEPDFEATLDEKKEIQRRIADTFYNINNMCVKFCNYIGLEDQNLTCYFDKSKYLYGSNVYNTKMLILRMLIAGSRVVNLNEIVQIESDNDANLPYYVNKPRVGFEYINFQRIKTLLVNKLYYVYDMLVISCVNSQTNSANITGMFFFYDLIEMLSSYFVQHFGYDPELYIRSYSEDRTQNKAQVSIGYRVSDLSEVKTIDLLLDLYGSQDQISNS